jgi:hypothetical protein
VANLKALHLLKLRFPSLELNQSWLGAYGCRTLEKRRKVRFEPKLLVAEYPDLGNSQALIYHRCFRIRYSGQGLNSLPRIPWHQDTPLVHLVVSEDFHEQKIWTRLRQTKQRASTCCRDAQTRRSTTLSPRRRRPYPIRGAEISRVFHL